jgi:hypothetical protein
LNDVSPHEIDNFYRVKSVGINGEIKYSSIVKVSFIKYKPSISIYPNPVRDGIINMQMSNMPKGEYSARVINNLGQTVLVQRIQHLTVSTVESINAKQFLYPGNYQLEILQPDKKMITLQFVNY